MRAHSIAMLAFALAACGRPTTGPTAATGPLAHAVVPIPATIEISRADSFLVTPRTVVFVDADASAEVEAIGTYTANLIASTAGATAQRLAAGARRPTRASAFASIRRARSSAPRATSSP